MYSIGVERQLSELKLSYLHEAGNGSGVRSAESSECHKPSSVGVRLRCDRIDGTRRGSVPVH